jgi:hypothetical protein
MAGRSPGTPPNRRDNRNDNDRYITGTLLGSFSIGGSVYRNKYEFIMAHVIVLWAWWNNDPTRGLVIPIKLRMAAALWLTVADLTCFI